METFDLSHTELRTVVLLARGGDTKDIASELNVTKSYIYSIIRQLKCRFGTKTTAGSVSCAIARGIIDLEALDERSDNCSFERYL